MKLSYANSRDINQILSMIKEAQTDFKSANIDQWQNGYPNRQTIEEDIDLKRGYVIIDNEIICGYCVIDFEPDPNYEIVYNGKFHNNHQYATIHRFVIKREFQRKHLGLEAFSLIEELVKDCGIDTIRVDTHAENLKMQGLINRCHFQYCGIIKLDNTDAERLAFDKLII